MAYMRSAINTPAMFRALADLAEQFPCSCPDLTVNDTGNEFPVMSFGDTFHQKPTASRIDAGFEIGVAGLKLRMAYAIAYKRHSGEHAPFLLPPERDAVDLEMAGATLALAAKDWKVKVTASEVQS